MTEFKERNVIITIVAGENNIFNLIKKLFTSLSHIKKHIRTLSILFTVWFTIFKDSITNFSFEIS